MVDIDIDIDIEFQGSQLLRINLKRRNPMNGCQIHGKCHFRFEPKLFRGRASPAESVVKQDAQRIGRDFSVGA